MNYAAPFYYHRFARLAGGVLDSTGSFAFIGVPLKKYELEVIAPGYKPAKQVIELDDVILDQYSIPVTRISFALKPSETKVELISRKNSNKGWILGKLVGAEPTTSLEMMYVSLKKSSRLIRDVPADKDGYFVFNEPEGNYNISINHDSYLRELYPVQTVPLDSILNGGGFNTITLNPISSIADNPICSIEGRAKSGKKLLKGASVSLSDINKTTETDSSGKFQFKNLTRGDYDIIISMPDYYDFRKSFTINTPKKLSPRPLLIEAELVEVVPKYRIFGIVKDYYTGLPIPGTSVQGLNRTEGFKNYHQWTDQKGVFFMPSVPSGKNHLIYEMEGYRVEKNIVNIPEKTSETHVFDTSINLVSYNDTISSGYAQVNGKIIDAMSGFPISGVEIQVDDKMVVLRNDDEGEFRIEKLPRGKYNLTLFPDDLITYLTYNGIKKDFFIELVNSDDIDTVTWDIELKPGAWLPHSGRFTYGRVFDSETQLPVSCAELLINPGIHHIVTDDSGRYQFFLPTENYKIQVFSNEHHLTELTVEVNDTNVAAYKDALENNFFLNKATTISTNRSTLQGKITDAVNGKPVYMAQVFVLGTELSAMTDREGNFTIQNIPSGVSKIEINAIGCMPFETAIEISGNKETFILDAALEPMHFTNHPMQIRYKETRRKKQLKYMNIAGSVFEKINNTPVPSALLLLSSLDYKKDTLCVVTNTEGRFIANPDISRVPFSSSFSMRIVHIFWTIRIPAAIAPIITFGVLY